MKTKEEIEKRKHELQKEYSDRFFSVGNTPETDCVGEMIALLDWVLETSFITISETEKL